MTTRVFETPDDMARYQAGRELAEALAVQAMSSEERFLWLHKVWGRLQASAGVLHAGRPATRPTARAFATPEEKNRFDDDRELALAQALASAQVKTEPVIASAARQSIVVSRGDDAALRSR